MTTLHDQLKQALNRRQSFQKTAAYVSPNMLHRLRQTVSNGVLGGAAATVGMGGLIGLATGRLGRWNTKKNLGSSVDTDSNYAALSEYLSTLPDDPSELTDSQVASVNDALTEYTENRTIPWGSLVGASAPLMSALAAAPLARKLIDSKVVQRTLPEVGKVGKYGVNAPLSTLTAILAAGSGALSQMSTYNEFDRSDPVVQKAYRLLGQGNDFQDLGADAVPSVLRDVARRAVRGVVDDRVDR